MTIPRFGCLLVAALLVLVACGGPPDVPQAPPSVVTQEEPKALTTADVLMRAIDDPDTIVDWAYVTATLNARDQGPTGSGGRGWTMHGPVFSDAEAREIGSQLHQALPRKRGAALLPSVLTAARLGYAKGPEFREAALRAWPETDANTRAWWLDDDQVWAAIKDERMRPFLQKAIASCPENGVTWSGEYLPDRALQRFVDIDPEKGRALVLADIRRKKPRFGALALTSLADEHLEDVDAHWRRPLKELMHWSFDQEKHGPLAERYGGSDALKTAKTILDDPKHVTNTHLLRVVMAHDREDAFRRMAKALATRDPKHPYKHRLVLHAVLGSDWVALPSYWGPDAEAFVRRYLEDPDSKVAEEAAQLLEDNQEPAATDAPK